MQSEWAKFYQSRVNSDSYTNYFKSRYEPFLNLIQNNWSDKTAEFGCGVGTVTKCLELVPTFLADIEPEMLMLSKDNLLHLDTQWVKHDILNIFPQKLDLIYSHGVLEHFSDKSITTILRNQLLTGAKLIHYVPTNMYTTPSFGDERLLAVQYWIDKFKPSYSITFNNGHDLALVWNNILK
jgi:trans-aconitate methyltransferase